MINFPFNSRNANYKKPFGAVPSNGKIEFSFPVSKCFSLYGVSVLIKKDGDDHSEVNYPLCESWDNDGYVFYNATIEITTSGIYWYRFEVYEKSATIYIGKGEGGRAQEGFSLPKWQITVYDANYSAPSLLKGGIIYHIFVDRFNKGEDESCRFEKQGELKEWEKDVTICDSDGVFRANDFFGGNLQGIIDKLDYLKNELEVSLIYLSPIFKSGSNHRYDTGNYMEIDELLGNEESFKKLISEAGKRGMQVMLDGVFNHTGADSVYFNKFNNYKSLGAFQSNKSPFYNWFNFTQFPDEYNCWWGITVTPTINKNNASYQKFLYGSDGIIEKWNNFGIAGWRLDVVDELPERFTTELIKKIKESDNKIVIGEVWEDASNKVAYGTRRPYLLGNQLDGTMNYPFKQAIIDFVLYKNIDLFKDRILTILENYPRMCLDNSMTFLSTHDTVRIINVFAGLDVSNTTKAVRQNVEIKGDALDLALLRLNLATALLFTLPGTPSIYYGDEVGLTGYEDPLNRRPFPWGRENLDVLNQYSKLCKMRKKYANLWRGKYKFEEIKRLLVFNITSAKNHIKVIVNNASTEESYTLKTKCLNVLTNKVTDEMLVLPPFSFKILHYVSE